MHDQIYCESAFVPTDIQYAKAKAKLLRKLVPAAELSLGQAQQLTAKALGHQDWHALEEALKAKTTSSLPSPLVSAAEQTMRWKTQLNALLTGSSLSREQIALVLEEWQLTGPAPAPAPVSRDAIAVALDKAWPADESRLACEIMASVRFVVQLAIENRTEVEGPQWDLRNTPFEALLETEFAAIQPRVRGPRASERTTFLDRLRAELTSRNDTVNGIERLAILRLYGDDALYRTEPASSAVTEALADRLLVRALASAKGKTLWDLFFVAPSADGLIGYRNSRLPLNLEDEGGDDDDDDEDGNFGYVAHLAETLGDFKPHAQAIVMTQPAPNLKVSIRHTPDYNDYADEFRLTRIAALVSKASKDNVGFADGVLFESSQPGVSKFAFTDTADSLDQLSLEMAEAVTKAFPRVSQSFDKGAFLHITDFELASAVRGQEVSDMLLESLILHCQSLAGPVSAICLDVRPPQFPWMSYEHLPNEIREECGRVNTKIRKRLKKLLAGRVFKDIPTRLVRFCYPDGVVEKM